MPFRTASILAVDDDVHILRLLRKTLEPQGWRVFTAGKGDEALDTFAVENPDLLLLDVTMPGMDGFTVCKRIRDFSDIPIIMVTARGSEDEIVRGLEAGANDYIVKPFSTRELVARVKANLRKTESGEKGDGAPVFHAGDLTVDFAAGRVLVGDRDIRLTATEFRILSYLARNAGRVLTPDQILTEVWGETYCGETHILQVNMARLRKKIEKVQKYILTRSGIGYTMEKI